MERLPPPRGPDSRELERSGEPDPASEIRGLGKFGRHVGASEHDEEPRLSQRRRVEVRGLEKFKQPTETRQPPEESARVAKRSAEGESPALAVKSLPLTDQVSIRTPEGIHTLEFFHRGHFEVRGPDGAFIGDGQASEIALGTELNVSLNGRLRRLGPIVEFEHRPASR